MNDREVLLQAGLKLCGDFAYFTSDDNEANIMKYIGNDEDVTVPAVVDGLPVICVESYITRHTFEGCTALKTVTFSEGIRQIWISFDDCKLLETINIPASATEIFGGCNRCPSHSRLNVHKDNPNYTDIDGVLYSKDKKTLILVPQGHAIASMEHYDIPEGVIGIRYMAFEECVFRSVTIPKSMTKIDHGAFEGCRSLESVTLHDGVTEIDGGAFDYCVSLASVHIPASVTKLSCAAFDDCWGLTSITVDENNPVYASFDGCLYDKGKTVLLYSPLGLEGSEEPESMTEIGRCAYRKDENLIELDVSARVTKIDVQTFLECPSLEYINVEEDNPMYCSVDGILFSKDKTKLVFYPHGKPKEYTVPDGVKAIGDYAFASSCLKSIKLPNSLTTIGGEAFRGCWIKDITLPDSVTEISDNAFDLCEELSAEALERVRKINPRVWTFNSNDVLTIRVG
jgi:hypothetical protein